ncbi:MAG: GerMN domain-containing protein [Treponema sp.]|nr:GerMN domain-containing protein [Treponema sp.]
MADDKVEHRRNDDDFNERTKRNRRIAVLVWLLAAIVMFSIFMAKKDVMSTNIENTHFFDRLAGKKVNLADSSMTESYSISKQIEDDKIKKNDVEPVIIDVTQNNNVEEDYFVTPPPVTLTGEDSIATENSSEETRDKDKAKKNDAETMTLKLYWIKVDRDGMMTREEIPCEMPKSVSPLKDAINALIKGPEENNKGYRTFIPEGTKLLGASVKNGVAYLNFNENFEFNSNGIEGTMGQLEQVVFTATAFPTVNSVQFLVAGQKLDYMSSEGVFIGIPLSRASF